MRKLSSLRAVGGQSSDDLKELMMLQLVVPNGTNLCNVGGLSRGGGGKASSSDSGETHLD